LFADQSKFIPDVVYALVYKMPQPFTPKPPQLYNFFKT